MFYHPFALLIRGTEVTEQDHFTFFDYRETTVFNKVSATWWHYHVFAARQIKLCVLCDSVVRIKVIILWKN
jgi:hypothetical protein